MSSSQSFEKITRALKLKVPATLQKILVATSFDSKASILGINSEIIAEIEKYVNSNKSILENTEYQSIIANDSTFKFKPGHISVLKLLPKSLCDSNKQKKKKIEVEENKEEQLQIYRHFYNFMQSTGKNTYKQAT